MCRHEKIMLEVPLAINSVQGYRWQATRVPLWPSTLSTVVNGGNSETLVPQNVIFGVFLGQNCWNVGVYRSSFLPCDLQVAICRTALQIDVFHVVI